MKEIINIKNFLNNGTFFSNLSPNMVLPFLKKYSDDVFGTSVKMYYFYKHGYSISFVYDENNSALKGEQIEICNYKKIKNNLLKNLIYIKNIEFSFLNENIESIYSNEDEFVIFLNNGINLYYNKNQHCVAILSKIISLSKESRLLVENLMHKIEKYELKEF